MAASCPRAITPLWHKRSCGCFRTRPCGNGWGTRGSHGLTSVSPSSGWSWRRPPPTPAWPAEATKRALRIRRARSGRTAIESARVHHPEMAQREVVLHRVLRIEPPQRSRDVPRHGPPGARVAGQTKAPADANDVRVERHDELGRRHARPDAEVEPVATDHPTQEQI